MGAVPGVRPPLAGGCAAGVWLLVCALLWVVPGVSRADTEALWQALARGDAVALVRHAQAPGTGDPAGFDVSDCGTQRNLSQAGRRQARDIGARFRAHGITAARVWSSPWCRCLETARLLGLGEVRAAGALGSFFQDPGLEAGHTAAALALIRGESAPGGAGPAVLVTHQVNISALTGVSPASGEMVVVRPLGDRLETLGRIR